MELDMAAGEQCGRGGERGGRTTAKCSLKGFAKTIAPNEPIAIATFPFPLPPLLPFDRPTSTDSMGGRATKIVGRRGEERRGEEEDGHGRVEGGDEGSCQRKQ